MKNIIMAAAMLIALFSVPAFSSEKQRVAEAEAALIQLVPEFGRLYYYGNSSASLPEGCVSYNLTFNTQGDIETLAVEDSDSAILPFLESVTDLIRSRVSVSPAPAEVEPLEVLAPICFTNEPDLPIDLKAVMEKRRNGVTNKEWLENLLNNEQVARNCFIKDETALPEAETMKPQWLDYNELQRIFDRAAPILMKHYHRAKQSSPCLGGAAVLSISVDGYGVVRELDIQASNSELQAFGETLLPIVEQLQFPKTGKTDRFLYALNFFPQ